MKFVNVPINLVLFESFCILNFEVSKKKVYSSVVLYSYDFSPGDGGGLMRVSVRSLQLLTRLRWIVEAGFKFEAMEG